MDLQDQLLFFFSALGAFNGLFLSLYFGFFIKTKTRATYFLAALLFVISVRVTKSVFLTFYSDISSSFIQVGLTACFLIGPFLYLYTKAVVKPDSFGQRNWLIHIIPIVVFMVIIGILYPYNEYWSLWQHKQGGTFGWMLFFQWLAYTIAAIHQARFSFFKLGSKLDKPSDLDYWLINIITGAFLIWLAYNTAKYTSYIVGALSFSFTFYVSLAIWFFRTRTNSFSFLAPTTKYGNKSISDQEALSITNKINTLFQEEKIYLKPNLKLSDLAKALHISPHRLSQYLNDNQGENFSNFINKYRIEAAVEMLQTKDDLTIAGIGHECGFKSNTSFYTAFKKLKGMTPAQFKKSLK